jgi:PAS domain S-box-containing protein
MFTTDINGRIVTWDRGAVDLFGYRKEDVLGEDASLIFLPEDIKKHAPEQEIAQAMENRIAPDERWHVRKDGSLFWANGLMMVMTDEAGRQIGFVKIVREGTPPSRGWCVGSIFIERGRGGAHSDGQGRRRLGSLRLSLNFRPEELACEPALLDREEVGALPSVAEPMEGSLRLSFNFRLEELACQP